MFVVVGAAALVVCETKIETKVCWPENFGAKRAKVCVGRATWMPKGESSVGLKANLLDTHTELELHNRRQKLDLAAKLAASLHLN